MNSDNHELTHHSFGSSDDEESSNHQRTIVAPTDIRNKRKNFFPRCSHLVPHTTYHFPTLTTFDTTDGLSDEKEQSPSPLPAQFCLISDNDAMGEIRAISPRPEVARLEFAMRTMHDLLNIYSINLTPRDIVGSEGGGVGGADIPEENKPIKPQFTPSPALLNKYLRQFASFVDCGNARCRAENVRDHYHCIDAHCHGRCFSKKEEIIRHVKWHKKRSESLTHGFLRFSATDDCTVHFGKACQHNRKQTHYHCLRANCHKVYISTSDVQTHANYHKKDSIIYQEGFQRFRATEECNTEHCPFSHQKTTHFHCRRSNCRYTFKNKADMEKHKTYHIKDEQLTRDGFKKFLKSESCTYPSCRFSHVVNHIHCTRENCSYVLHSSGQLISHKRKHERMDNEANFKRIRESSTPEMPTPGEMSEVMRLCTRISCADDMKPLNLTSDAPPIPLALPQPILPPPIPTTIPSPTMETSSDTSNHVNNSEDSPLDSSNPLQITSIDGFFNRKRGRPPKNRVVEVYNCINIAAQSPQAVFTSFKLDKTYNKRNEEAPELLQGRNDHHFDVCDQPTDCSYAGCSTMPHMDEMSLPPPPMGFRLLQSHPVKQARYEDDVTKSCRLFKDEPTPQGYVKFRFNEDCKFENCGYRNHQSHFHCSREDCLYSFCDKTRFVQHTARHERLDKLMGDDFRQYRSNMRCGYDACPYSKTRGANNKSSHFHCLKCDFICSDTNKVVAHRRQHTKLEYIRLAGFRKVSVNESCTIPGADEDPAGGALCSYNGRQTHYHCLVCNFSVPSRAQLTSHRHRE
ncbi:Transcription factor castor [Sergentomyia squamirostris]